MKWRNYAIPKVWELWAETPEGEEKYLEFETMEKMLSHIQLNSLKTLNVYKNFGE